MIDGTVRQLPPKSLTPNRWGPAVNPTLSKSDFAALADSIERDGVRQPLTVWRNGKGDLIVAGMTRRKIAVKQKIETVPVIFREFADETEAKLFAIEDNLVRRQMSGAMKAEQALHIQKLLTRSRGRKKSGEIRTDDTKFDARAEAARRAGVSASTMHGMQIILNHGDSELIQKVRTGVASVSGVKRYVQELQRQPDVVRNRLVEVDGPVFSCIDGDNGTLIANIASLHLEPGDKIADVTFARGLFWSRHDTSQYDFHSSDIAPISKEIARMDFRDLRYELRGCPIRRCSMPWPLTASTSHRPKSLRRRSEGRLRCLPNAVPSMSR